ncbi:MAG TPA: HRDC domain-containing protein [Planctomycetota bacterium]|nr:HRDC domain-containing protein [Planctomycetota bacterium]
MLPELAPPTIVADGAALRRLVDDLAAHDEIAVDTEADSFFSYREKVCLMQITAGDRDWLVDPLGGLDLAPLGPILADASKTKIFHDGEYDVLILKRAWGFEFGGLFDTRVAASALGDANPGLASVLKTHFDLDLDKSMQRSDWSARPLSEKQVRYAQIDTHFLVGLMHRQKSELERAGRTAVVDGECRRLEQLVPPDNEFSADEFVRVKGVRVLSKQARQNLRELFALRDRLAREADLPPFKVVSNQALTALAERPPASARELTRLSGISSRLARKHGEDVMAALERARELGPLERLPVARRNDGPHLDELETELHERLKQWRKLRAQELGFDAALVLNRHVLARLALQKPRDLESLGRIEGLLDWQLDAFGPDLARAIDEALVDIERNGLPRRGNRGWGRQRR